MAETIRDLLLPHPPAGRRPLPQRDAAFHAALALEERALLDSIICKLEAARRQAGLAAEAVPP